MKANWRVCAGTANLPRTWWVAPMCGLVVALTSVLCALMRAWGSVAMGWFYSGVLFVATVGVLV